MNYYNRLIILQFIKLKMSTPRGAHSYLIPQVLITLFIYFRILYIIFIETYLDIKTTGKIFDICFKNMRLVKWS